MGSIISMNRSIIRVFNSQTISQFKDLMDEIVLMDRKKITKLFTSKWYVWNIIRNKDFYKLMAIWLIGTEEYTDTHFYIIKLVLNTANNDTTRRSFTKAIITKKCILTVDTIKYIYELDTLIAREEVEAIVADEYIKPIISLIESYESKIAVLLMG